MLELSTVTLTREEIDQFIGGLRRMKLRPPNLKTAMPLTLSQRKLTDFSDYEIEPGESVTMEHGQSVFCNGHLDDFWRVLRAMKSRFTCCVATVEIAEAGKDFNLEEGSDLQLSFGVDFVGPLISISTGAFSSGHDDLESRKSIFNHFLTAVGLNEDLQAVVISGELDIEVANPNFHFRTEFPSRNLPELFRDGVKLIRKGAALASGKNPRDLGLNCFDLEILPAKVDEVLRFHNPERIMASEFYVSCDIKEHAFVRDILNESLFSPWKVDLYGKPRYSLEDLHRLFAEADSFLLPLGAFKAPKVGEVNAQLIHENDASIINLYAEYKSEKQETALKDLIIGLAGGKDIIDHTPL